MHRAVCWAVTTGEAGMISQALGLAEASGLDVVEKRVTPLAPWRWLPGHLCPMALGGLARTSDQLAPPWPDLLVTCGRRSVALSIAVRRASGGDTYTVHIQNPRVPLDRFDLVTAPLHDGLAGNNVVPTRGAINRVTPKRLESAARELAPRLPSLPRPLVAVLIGGSNACYRLTPAVMTDITARLVRMAGASGAGLAVTPSRRTGWDNEAVLAKGLAGLPAWLWDGQGENPYFGMLGLADHIVVTCDSVSMVSEAATTGKPVHVIDLEGGNRRFRAFHDRLRADGVTRPFADQIETWSYMPLDDTSRVAGIVRQQMATRS